MICHTFRASSKNLMLFKFYIALLVCVSVYQCSTIINVGKLIQCKTSIRAVANPNMCNFLNTLLENKNDGAITSKYLENEVRIEVPRNTRDCVCKHKKCVRLCCPLAHSLNIIQIKSQLVYKCVKITEHNKDLNNLVLNKSPCQIDFWSNLLESMQHWEMLSDGSLAIGEHTEVFVVTSDWYCLTHTSDNSTGALRTNVIFCTNAADSELTTLSNSNLLSIFNAAFILVPVIFFSLTLFVYFWIDELKTLHGKTFMCYLATLGFGYSALAFYRNASWHARKQPVSCLILAEIIYATLIAAFIWLSIIGYDIWRAVGRKNQSSNQFSKYCLFTGVTTVIIVLITNTFDNINLLDVHYRPGLGTSLCWLQDTKYAYFLYLYSIIIFTILLNIVFFLLTKWKLERLHKFSSNATTGNCSKKFAGSNDREVDHFQLFTEIGIIMGLPWLFEIISWFMEADNYMIYFAEIITMLQGPVIFLICIRKPRVKRLIEQRWSTST